MSSQPHRLNRHEQDHHDQNALPPHNTSQQLYNAAAPNAQIAPGLSPATALMGTPRFDSFHFSFPGALDSSNVVHQQQPGVGGHGLDGYPHTGQMPAVEASRPAQQVSFLGASMGNTTQHDRSLSLEGSDGIPQDEMSLLAASSDEPMVEDFASTALRSVEGVESAGDPMPWGQKRKAPPAWSEMKTKAGKDRKRLPLACIACRRKKIKCSGDFPACSHCVRARIPCVYKTSTRKPTPRTDYTLMLDKRIKRMEDRLIKAAPKSSEEGTTAIVTRAVVKPEFPHTVKKRTAEQAFANLLANTSGSGAAVDDRPNALAAQEAEEKKLMREGRESLPKKDQQHYLSEVFFRSVYGQTYHLLHKPSYMQQLEDGTLPPVLILSVCAISARFAQNNNSNDQVPRFLRGEAWASKARDICTRNYDTPNLTILTCLLILGLHEFGTCQGGRSWALGGLAIRMAFALQLHKDLDYDPMRRDEQVKLTVTQRELRRRLMWACFMIDRFNSSGTDRPMFIREETIEIPLPVNEKLFEHGGTGPTQRLDGQVVRPATIDAALDEKEAMGTAAHVIRAVAVWGRIITYLYQKGTAAKTEPIWDEGSEFAALARDALGFPSTLPDSLKYTHENIKKHMLQEKSNQFPLLHIIAQQNILFLNQAGFTTMGVRQDAPNDFFNKLSTGMFSAARLISDVLMHVERSGCIVTAPFVGYSALCSAKVLVWGMASGGAEIKDAAVASTNHNIKYLEKVEKYWGIFHWMLEDFRAHYLKTLNPKQTGRLPKGTNEKSPPLLQYGDWFKRYPRGLSATELADPSKGRSKDADQAALEGNPSLQSVDDFLSGLSSEPKPETEEPRRKALSRKRRSISDKRSSQSMQPQSQGQDEPQDQRGQRRQSQPQPEPPQNLQAYRPRQKSFQQQFEQQQQQQHQQPQLHPSQLHQMPPIMGSTMPDPMALDTGPHRSATGAFMAHTSGPSSFSTLPTASQTQDPGFHAISPVTPVGLSQYPNQASLYPDFLAGHNQQGNLLQPLDGMPSYYGMEGGSFAPPPNMDPTFDWDGLLGPPLPNNLDSHVLGSNLVSGMSGMTGHEASPAWFEPFNMEQIPNMKGPDLGMGGADMLGPAPEDNPAGPTTSDLAKGP